MGKRNNDKGFITWIMTLVTLILVGGTAITFITLASTGSGTWAIVMSILVSMLGIYIFWHGIMILLGKAENTWVFVIACFIAGIIGGILMLIAKILN